MKPDLSKYGYNNFKLDFEKVSIEDLKKAKPPLNLTNAFEGFVLPLEMAARLSTKLGFDQIMFPYRNVPLTNRNIIESHLFTKCALLPNPELTYNRLLPIYNSIGVWGEVSEKPTSYMHFNKFLHENYLDLLQDRIRHLPPSSDLDEMVLNDQMLILKSCGVSYHDVYRGIIDYINTTVNFKYERNIINFLKNHLEINLTKTGVEYLKKLPIMPGFSNFGLRGKNYLAISRFLFSAYFSQYKQWLNGSSWVDVKGDRIYVDHHSVQEIGDFDEYMVVNSKYPNQLPFGIHPSKYFEERIRKLAVSTHSEAKNVTYPSDFNGYLDLSNSPHRQLLTGLDLVNEGVYMKHCVGGENYQRQMEEGEALFFHLHVPGVKHGTTLSMERSYRHSGSYRLNGKWWSVDQYYGYDDEEANHGVCEITLQEFLNTYFTPYINKQITAIHVVHKKHDYDYVYCQGWEKRLVDEREDHYQLAWRNLTDRPRDFSFAAMPESTNTTDQNFRSLYHPELVTQLCNSSWVVDEAVARQRHAYPRHNSLINWNELRPDEESFFHGMSTVIERGISGIGLSTRHTSRSRFSVGCGELRPIKLNDVPERMNTVVNGVIVSQGVYSGSVIVPADGQFQIVTENFKTVLRLAIVDRSGGNPRIKTARLRANAIYTNTSGMPQEVSAFVLTEIQPAKLPLTINSLFYPDNSISVKHNTDNHNGGVMSLYGNNQAMGHARRT